MDPLLIIDSIFGGFCLCRSLMIAPVPTMTKTRSSAAATGELFATQCTCQLFGSIQSYQGELLNSTSFCWVHLMECQTLSLHMPPCSNICFSAFHKMTEHCQLYIVNFGTTISMYYQNLETVQSSKLVKYVFKYNLNPLIHSY